MAEDDIPRIADLAVANPYANPRPVTRTAVEALLRAAWSGDRPVSSPHAAPRRRDRCGLPPPVHSIDHGQKVVIEDRLTTICP
jgi:hypothetical protein